MGFFKNMVKNAVSEGINKGLTEAVSSAAEKIIAPKAEAYANKMASTLDEATNTLNEVEKTEETPKRSGLSSLEASLNRFAEAAEKYEANMEEKYAPQINLAEEWEKKLPDFPTWCFGGTDFWFSDIGNAADGAPYIVFNAENTTQESLDLYVELLKHEGFVQKFKGYDDTLYKDLGGVYLVFGKTEAFNAAPVMSLTFVRTTDKSEIEIK